MKGKYANAAEKRREMDSLEARALEATRAQDRVEAELAALKSQTAAEIADLKARLRNAISERDAAQGPALKEADAQMQALREELTEAWETHKAYRELYQGVMRGCIRYLVKVQGFTAIEAQEILLNFVPGKEGISHIYTSDKRRHGGDVERELRLQTARGERHKTDFVSLLLADPAEEEVAAGE